MSHDRAGRRDVIEKVVNVGTADGAIVDINHDLSRTGRRIGHILYRELLGALVNGGAHS